MPMQELRPSPTPSLSSCILPPFSISCFLSLLPPLPPPPLSLPSGIAPLFLAARGGLLELVKALTKKGADVNSLGASQGISALHWAAHKEHEDVALFLIENGGDISLLDKEGRTPLSMASPELVTKMIGEGGGEGEGEGEERGSVFVFTLHTKDKRKELP